jgi:hypothetical protein
MSNIVERTIVNLINFAKINNYPSSIRDGTFTEITGLPAQGYNEDTIKYLFAAKNDLCEHKNIPLDNVCLQLTIALDSNLCFNGSKILLGGINYRSGTITANHIEFIRFTSGLTNINVYQSINAANMTLTESNLQDMISKGVTYPNVISVKISLDSFDPSSLRYVENIYNVDHMEYFHPTNNNPRMQLNYHVPNNDYNQCDYNSFVERKSLNNKLNEFRAVFVRTKIIAINDILDEFQVINHGIFFAYDPLNNTIIELEGKYDHNQNYNIMKTEQCGDFLKTTLMHNEVFDICKLTKRPRFNPKNANKI